jgi:hypothetical protein
MADYLIRYLRRDGTVSMFYRANMSSDADALRQARRFRLPDMKIEVWNGQRALEVLVSDETDAASHRQSTETKHG